MMEITFGLAKGFKPDKDVLKTCDKAAHAMQGLLVETTKITFPALTPLMWLLTRFYRRRIFDDKISYQFYLINGQTKK